MFSENNNSVHSTQLRETNFMARVFCWMSAALAVSAVTAYFTATSSSFMKIIAIHPWIMIVLFGAQLALVMGLSLAMNRLSVLAAFFMFGLYSILMGIMLSTVFLAYTNGSIFTAFIVAAGMFGAMAIYGIVTNADLSSLSSFSFMAIIGLIIAGVVNMFLKSQAFEYLISAVGVFIFTLLTAYDVQRIKHMGAQMLADRETVHKAALMGALALYLDFINLFLYLLNLLGKRRD